MVRVKMLGTRVRTGNFDIAPPPPKKVDPFYLTPEWRMLIDRLLKDRGRKCEECGRTGCRIFGDHIIEIKDGGAKLDPLNIKLLCGRCHTIKTNRMKLLRSSSMTLPTQEN